MKEKNLWDKWRILNIYVYLFIYLSVPESCLNPAWDKKKMNSIISANENPCPGWLCMALCDKCETCYR